MRKFKRLVFIPIIVIVGIIGVIPIAETSTLGFVGTNTAFLLPATLAYLILTTEAEIYLLIYLSKVRAWKKRGSRISSSKSSFHHAFIDWGFIGIFLFTALPFMGMIAIAIFAANYRKSTKRERILARALLYLGYVVRIALVSLGGLQLLKTFLPG